MNLNMQKGGLKRKWMDMKLDNEMKIVSADSCYCMRKHTTAEDRKSAKSEVAFDGENEGRLIVESLQKVYGKLWEARNYNEKMIRIVGEIANIAGEIYLLTEHEPPTMRKT